MARTSVLAERVVLRDEGSDVAGCLLTTGSIRLCRNRAKFVKKVLESMLRAEPIATTFESTSN